MLIGVADDSWLELVIVLHSRACFWRLENFKNIDNGEKVPVTRSKITKSSYLNNNCDSGPDVGFLS